MDTKKQREHLRAYTLAARQIELAGVAIGVLEGMNTREASQAIKTLQRGQQRQLKLLDAAAERLGAPYGA
jgi:hypothetical protein